MSHPDRKVSINKGAVQELALYGPQDRVESLFRETARTLTRLGIDAAKARLFRKVLRYQGGRPNIHDIMRWLDDLKVAPEGDAVKYAGDVKFLKQLHATVRGRTHPDVIKQVEG